MNEKFQLVAYASTGAAIAVGLVVPLLRILLRTWFDEQKAFKMATLETLGRLTKALDDLEGSTASRFAATEKHFDVQVAMAIRSSETLAQALRDEGAAAREVLRQHVDHEDHVIRERNHQLAGKMGAVRTRVAIVNENVNSLVKGLAAVVETVHDLEVTVASKLTAKTEGA